VISHLSRDAGEHTLLPHLDRRDIDIVMLPGDIVALHSAEVGGFLPHPKGRRDLGLRRVLAAIPHAETLVSDVEDDSAYLVWRNN